MFLGLGLGMQQMGGGIGVPGGATHLVVTQQPSNGLAAITALGVQPIVTAKNVFGITDTSFTGVVTATIASGSGGTLSGATATCVSGIATFSALAFPAGNDTFTLTFSSGALTPATSSSFTTDQKALIAAAQASDAGQDVDFAYDYRFLTSGFGTTGATWKDSLGNAPDIVANSGSPTLDATLGVQVVSGSSRMASATHALFNPAKGGATQGGTVVVIGSLPSNIQNIASLVYQNGVSKWMGIGSLAGKWATYVSAGGLNGFQHHGTPVGTTCRMLTLAWSGSTQFSEAAVNGPNWLSDVFGNWGNSNGGGLYPVSPHLSGFVTPADNFHVQLGKNDLQGGTDSGNFRVFMQFKQMLNTVCKAALIKWATAYHQIVEDTQNAKAAMCIGTSNTYGTGGTPGTDDWPTQLGSRTGWTNAQIGNLGVPSVTGIAQLGRLPYILTPMVGISASKCAVLFKLIHNDIADPNVGGTNRTEAVVKANHLAVIAQIRALVPNVTFIADFTQPDSVAFGAGIPPVGGIETIRQAIDVDVRGLAGTFSDANGSYQVICIDWAAITNLNNLASLPTTWRASDGKHITGAGATLGVDDATNGVVAVMAAAGW